MCRELSAIGTKEPQYHLVAFIMKASVWANVLEEGQENTVSDQKRPESDQKSDQMHQILDLIKKNPRISRAELSEKTGLHDSSVIGVSDYLTGPEGFEEVGHVIEVHITATAADTVLGHNDLLGVRMLLRELRYSLLVIVVNMLL